MASYTLYKEVYMVNIYNVNEENESLKLPAYYDYYHVKERSNLYAIAKEQNINPHLLGILNGLEATAYVEQNQMLMLPKKEYAFYITKEGDTLETVREMFALDRQELIAINPVIYLHAGQLIAGKVK